MRSFVGQVDMIDTLPNVIDCIFNATYKMNKNMVCRIWVIVYDVSRLDDFVWLSAHALISVKAYPLKIVVGESVIIICGQTPCRDLMKPKD